MEPMDYHYITNPEKRQFLHLAVKESLMKRRVHLLRQLSVAYNSQHVRELDSITSFISSLDKYTYTEDALSTQTLDGVTYRGVTLQQFYGKTLNPNSEFTEIKQR